jgi:hypothetical protein
MDEKEILGKGLNPRHESCKGESKQCINLNFFSFFHLKMHLLFKLSMIVWEVHIKF